MGLRRRPRRRGRRRLVIVARDEMELLSSLVAEARDDPLTEVLFDRRVGQRRRGLGSRVPERRRADRRRVDITEDLNSEGYAVVYAARP
jgi:hypothetical protein